MEPIDNMTLGKWMKKRGEGLKKLVHHDKAAEKENEAPPAENAPPPESARAMPTADVPKQAPAAEPQDETVDINYEQVSYHGEEMWC